MAPDRPLPHSTHFAGPEAYILSLLDQLESNARLAVLCGGVHVLDFFTSTPDLYSQLLPAEWRAFFAEHEILDILDLLMREDLDIFASSPHKWREGAVPPQSLIEYITTVRLHLLLREPTASQCSRNRQLKLARQVTVGMNIKKVHEVGLFASYVDTISSSLSSSSGEEITHLVDFGSGQNYLGRALASEPYNRSIVAIEGRANNEARAREYDVSAKLAAKKVVMRNKKAFRAGTEEEPHPQTPPPEMASDSMPLATDSTSDAKGKIQYILHHIASGDLSDVIAQIPSPISATTEPPKPEPNLLVMSLHSCGNLVHHGLRSLLLNPSVRAVAMVGCCYNLMTERCGPATYKLDALRPESTSTTSDGDPDGFPMSNRFLEHTKAAKGLRLNITARMLAVQAPSNWREKDSSAFFTRHFYRALLQRIFLDRGCISPPAPFDPRAAGAGGESTGQTSGTPILIGSLPKSSYSSFLSYVRAALGKVYADSDPSRREMFRTQTANLTDADIEDYEEKFKEKRKELCVVWSLMAFSAGVVEAVVVVDRWCWLQEQERVKEAWVEAVFDYGISPRNLVVVGIKK